MSIVIHGPRANRRVTCVTNPENAHSESDLAVNPLNPYNMVGSSKRFTDITNYVFSLAAQATFDGGQTWKETILPLKDTDGTTYPITTDPAVIFDDLGNVYIVALPMKPFKTPGHIPDSIGISIYQSTDGGRTWRTPVLIHSGTGDDKQAVWADTNPTSKYKGNVYAVWVDTNNYNSLLFARTTNHGASWKGITVGGVDQHAGTAIPGIFYSYSPEITVAADGTVIIVWVDSLFSDIINLVTSSDGGSTFSAPMTVASGIGNLSETFPIIDRWPVLPGSSPGIRVFTFATGSTSGTNLVVVWADGREGDSRIYYRHSPNLGSSWDGPASGQPLLTGALASVGRVQDFLPQIATTPTGEIGCVFYEYFTQELEFSRNLINVILAVSTDNGATFTNRVTVSDVPWNPALDAPNADMNPSVKFIGDYFGLAASSLGFFPFWTDTRSGFQDIFVARVSLYPADLYLRDGPGDKGDVPSPDKVFWESPDIVVRHQQDGDTNFVDQGLLRDGVTDHYVYGRATNRGPNDSPAATLAVTVGNYPSLLGAPGAEFWYPQDWYPDDWNTAAVRNNHLYLGESAPLPIPKGGKAIILGPVLWPAAKIPVEGTWHPCLLGEVRCGNDDSAGGKYGADIFADPAETCPHGSFVYGNNNVCHRNLTYVPVPVKKHKAVRVELPFTVGSVWDNKARFIEVTVDKGRDLASVPMSLRMETVTLPGTGGASDGDQGEPCPCEPGEIVFTGNCRVIVRVGKCEAGEIITTPGTVWRAYCPEKPKPVPAPTPPAGKGMEPSRSGTTWQLTEPRSTVGFSVAAREMRKLTLSFTSPTSLRKTATVRISERKDGKFVTGGVSIQLVAS